MTRPRLRSDFFNGLLAKIMYRDSVAEEVHRTRQKLLKECGHDLDRLLDRMNAGELKNFSDMVDDICLPR